MGASAMPELSVTLEQLTAHLRANAPRDGDWQAHRQALHGEDLFVAVACRHADSNAVALVVEQHVPNMVAALTKRGLMDDDIQQEVMEKLFVGDKPRIAQYAGLGSLKSWLVSVGVRTALNAKRRVHREVELEPEHLFTQVQDAVDAELGAAREAFRKEVKRAFQETFLALTSRQRNVLRYQYLHRMNLDAIGALYGVHRATVARWREATRAALLEGTRQRLKTQNELRTSELDSMLRLVESGLDVSLSRILREPTQS